MRQIFKQTKGLKKIGVGSFTDVFELNEREVLISSACMIKECISFGWFPDSELFPVLERIDRDEIYKNGLCINLFKAEKLQKVTAPKKQLTVQDYNLYTELRKVFNYTPKGKHFKHEHLTKEFKSNITNEQHLEALQSALDACMNYGSDVSFEISPRNIMLNSKGGLVLNDCFFLSSNLETSKVN